jgi:hypothetical protein
MIEQKQNIANAAECFDEQQPPVGRRSALLNGFVSISIDRSSCRAGNPDFVSGLAKYCYTVRVYRREGAMLM